MTTEVPVGGVNQGKIEESATNGGHEIHLLESDDLTCSRADLRIDYLYGFLKVSFCEVSFGFCDGFA
jgi:hypothetical protein